MSFPSDEFEDRLHCVLADGKYLWCYGLTGTESESDEEAPVIKCKKKKHTTANSVEIKADRIEALANELKQKHGESIQECSTSCGQKLPIAKSIPA